MYKSKNIIDMKNLFYLVLLATTSVMFLCGCEKEETFKVKACFSYHATENIAGEVQFNNCSENAQNFMWDFGDSTTSTEKEPKHIFDGNFPFLVSLIAINGNDRDTIILEVNSQIMVYKPNIYIYPINPIKLGLEITFPLGGSITESIPEYNNGWFVNVDSNGIINNKFNYLFYESIQPNIFQYYKGWCIAQADLKTFFEKNMTLYNFSKNEITDFTDYWVPKLIENDYYLIYPQTNEIIDKIIQLNFSIRPNEVNRLFYGIVGINMYTEIEAPPIVKFNRNGFYIMEWGVFIK